MIVKQSGARKGEGNAVADEEEKLLPQPDTADIELVKVLHALGDPTGCTSSGSTRRASSTTAPPNGWV